MASLTVAVVGSGFGGSILARVLHRQGHRVVLLERARHPRFALGESSTPLGALCLERLAERWDLPDLLDLAAWGRWMAAMPEVERGLKRGFTFYGLEPDQPFRGGPDNPRRLLVAASPSDAVADTHWLRSAVDAHLTALARDAGVDVREETRAEGLDADRDGFRLAARHQGRPLTVQADVVVDGSGRGGFLPRALDLQEGAVPAEIDTALVYGHFRGLSSFSGVASAAGAELPPGPYPDHRAAVHLFLEEGWMYQLAFDGGVTSAGVVFRRSRLPEAAGAGDPEGLLRRVGERYPPLAAQLAGAEALRPVTLLPHLPHRFHRAAGERWALLPHGFAFLDPLFSTGIAWTLLAVERLTDLFAVQAELTEPALGLLAEGLARYGELLAAEADHLGELVAGAWRALPDFGRAAAHALLYFSAASFAEASQRLLPAPDGGWAWQGFLGADDPLLRSLFVEARERLGGAPESRSFRRWVIEAIAPRDVAGLDEPRHRRMIPVDSDTLVARASRLGLTAEEVIRQLPRLRGG